MPRNARHEFSSLELSALRGNLHSQDDADRERLKHALPNKLGFVQRSMKPNLLLSTSGAPKEFFEFERMPGISTELDGGSSVGPGLSPRGGMLRRKARTMGRSAPVLGSPRASHDLMNFVPYRFSFTVQEDKEVEPEILYLHSTWQKVRTLQAIGIKLGRAESSGQFLIRALTSLIYEPLANHKKAKEALLRQLLGYLVDAIGESSKVRSVERFEPLRAAETDAVSLILQYVLYFFDGRVGAHGLPDSCPAAVLPLGEKLSGARQLADAYEAVLKSVSSPPPLPQRELPVEIAQFFYDFFTKVAELAEPESSDEETEEAETTAGHSPATVSPATPVGAANLALEKQPSEALPVTHQTGLHPSEQHPPEKRKFRVPKELVKSSFGPPFRLERHGVVRVKHTNKMQRALLDLAEGISYKALDVMLPAEDQVELGVDKGFFRQKTQDEITNALGRAGGGGGGAASAEAAPGAEGAGGAGKESSGSDAAGPQDPGAPELARPHQPDSTKYHDYAEKCLDHVRGAMQGTIKDKKIIRVMNLKQFNLSDFRELLQKSVPVNSTVRRALERLLVLSNHGVMTGAYWNLPLSKQVFTTLLEKGRVCDAATGRQAFELIRGHVASKRRCICSDFLQKTPNNLVGKNYMVCAPQEREKELERERWRLAELMGGEEERLRKEKLRKEREEKRRRAAEMQVRTHMIGVEQLEQFLKNPDPCEKRGISFGAKGAHKEGENKDKEEGGNKDADEDDELNALGGGLVGGKKKDAKQQEAHKEMLKLLLHPDVLAEMARAEAGEGKLSSEPASGERGAGGSSTIVPRRSSYGGMSADGMGGYGGGSGTGGGQGHGEEIATSSTSKPKFKENAPVTEVSLEDVLVCLGGEIVMDATRNGGTGKAADTSVSGFSNTSETLAAEGGASPVSVAGGFSPVSLAAATSATAAANAVKIRCAKNKPGLEALALLRQKILEKFECTLDAFQNMAFLVSGMSDTSKKTWGHLTLPELQRVLSRIIGEVSVTFVQDLASLVDCPLACGRISLRELLVAVSVISPSLHVEFLRAKMVALHGDLKTGLEELLDPQATVTLIRKRVAEHQKMKRDSQQAGGFGGAGRRSSKSGRSSSKIFGSGGTSGVLGDDSRDRRSAAGGSKSSVYSSSGHYGGSSGGAASGGSLANLAAMPEHLLPGWKNPSSPPAGGSTAITGVDTTIFEESSVSAYPPVPEPSNKLYDENTTSGDLDFHRLVNTYAPKNFSSDPVFSKFADEVVMFPAPTLRQRSMSLKPGGGGESLATAEKIHQIFNSNPYRQKFADVFLLPVHTTDCNRVLSGRMERDQEELCLRENFRYLTESFVGRQLVESDEVLQQFCLTLGFFVERTQQMSLLNRYEAFRVFHAVNVRGRPYLTLSKLQCALQAAGANPIFDQLRAKMHSFFPLLCKAFMSASANRDARCSAADFESLLESLSLTQLDATNVFRSFVQFEFSSLDMWSFINIVLGAMCPSLILEQFAANDTLVAVLQGLAQFHFKPLVFDEFCNLCVNCGILDRRAIQLCFLFCDVDNSECVFPRELLTAFHVKLQLASDDDKTRRSSKKKGSQTSAAASAIADTLAREFAGTFAKCDLLKRVVKAPWSAAETEAVQGGFKTLKRLQTTKFGGPAGSGAHKKDNSPPRVPGFRQRRKLHTESEPPAVQVKGETYLNAVEAAPAELLHSDLIFNLEEYAKTKNAVNKQHKSLIEECGQRDMLELYFLRNKL
eukprot:g1865.t1